MSLEQVFARIKDKNISVAAEDGELVIRAPQGVMDADTIALLRQHKLDLLAALEGSRGGDGSWASSMFDDLPPLKITPDMLTLIDLSQQQIDSIVEQVPQGATNIQDIYPLAPLQEGILFHHLLDTQGDTYLLRTVLSFENRDFLDQFLDALQSVIDRHDILRSAMFWQDLLQPVQVVLRQAPLRVEQLSLREDGEALQQLLDFTDPHRLRLNLQEAPLLAAYVIVDQQSGECLLGLLSHHIVCDHISLEFIIAEIHLLLQNRGSELSPALPYRNFIAQLRSISTEAHEAYFRKQLADITEPTAPFGLIDIKSVNEIHEVSVRLPDTLAEKIKGVCRQSGVSAAVLFHLVWARVVAQCCGRDDVVFGTVLTGRLQGSAGADSALGMFINTLPIRINAGSNSVRQMVADTYRNLIDLLTHEQAPLPLAQRCSGVTGTTPLFTTLLNYRHSLQPDTSTSDGVWDGMRILIGGEERSNYPITLSVDDFGNGFGLTAQCVSGVEPGRITDYVLTAIEALTDTLMQNPEQSLRSVTILTLAERRQVLHEWNATEVAYPQDRCIHQLFEAQVEQTPNAIALTSEDQCLSYAELNAKANQLAHYLIAQGVGPDVLVGICIERSPEMVVGLLGILKAGSAYVPLDPHYPEERLRYMLADAGVELLLTRQGLTEMLAGNDSGVGYAPRTLAESGFGAEQVRGAYPTDGVVGRGRVVLTTLCLDSDWSVIAASPSHNPEPRNHPLDLAYIIYTSGSTGQPKGVAVTHRNAVHSTAARFAHYSDPVKAYLLLSSFAFDSSVAGIFWTLGQGGCLCLPAGEAGKDPAELAALIERRQVSHLLALPSLYALLLAQAPEKLHSLKAAIVAGEACATDVVKRHFDILPQTKLYNEYGPTEATVWSSIYQASLDDLDRPLSIGRPIGNVRLYILDQFGQPLPVGVAGELYIGGAGIVRGYLWRPELTAERFIPDPFRADGGRLYKTGDLARYRTDGAIEFLGRIDHQVKIRGFRIELGEIEAQLLDQPNVKEAVVLAREDQPGDKKLVAYLVFSEPAAGQDAAVLDNLKVRLKQTLPDYMVPSAFVILDAMPISANGKLDRKKLPAPDWSGLSNAEYAAPQTPVEAALIQIWQQLLAVERIGRHDNFFELGGDSILSIQVVSRARQAGIVVTPKQLFQQQTIAELAAVAETASRAVAEQGLVTGELPLTPIQHWFFERNLSKPQHWNQALMLSIKPDLTPAVFEAALHKLLIQHDALRMRFTEQPGQWLQTNLAEETHNILEYCDLSAVAAEQRSERLQAKAGACQASLDLSQGPLLRAVWFDMGDGGSQILIAIHHLVVDGVSWRILLEDLNLACRQKLAGECIQLLAKTTAFQYWAERLQALARSGELALDTGYWRDPRRKQAQTLPVDEPAGANRVELEEAVVVALNAEQTRALLQEVPAAYRTQIDEVLLTALALTLRGWISANDNGGIGAVSTTTLLIDREGHGREHLADDLDVSRTVGWFTNVYPLLLTIDSGDDLAQSLKSIKEQSRAVPAHGIGYGLLRYLSDDAELRQTLAGIPPARIIFNYLGQLDTALAGDALFQVSADGVGSCYDPAGERAHELDVVSSIQDGCLRLSWRYSRERYRRATLETLAGNYLQQLQTLIAHCTQAGNGGYTPSDFPLAALTQSQLGALNLPPRQIDDLYPLAPLQHGLMFHSLYEPNSNVYRIQLACRLTGKFDAVVFQQAWQQLLERHAILRTRFQVQGLEQPLQIVDKQARLPISEHDWRHLTEAERQQQWQTLQAIDHAQGFDFSRAPLMRLALATGTDEQHYLLWSYHHVLLDGWSMPLLIKEVFAIYHALQRGERPNLPAVKPYRDYIAWLQRQDGDAAESYWRQSLAGFEAATVLGTDLAPGGHRLAGKVQKQSLLLSEAETQCLQSFVKQRQLTLNTLAQAAWGLLLSHYSGSEDVVFGITVSGRPAELTGIEEQVGLFINTLPMRVRIKPENQIDDWLRDLFEQNQEMRRYEYAPLLQIQNGSDIGRGQNLFDSLLVFENYPLDQALMEIGGPLKIDEVVGNDPTNYPLTLTVFPGQQLLLEINHDVSRFTEGRVERMLTHLQQLLNGFAEQPQAKLGHLPTLTEAERRQVLHEWNATEVAYPQDRCIHQLFEAQAEQTPDAIALTFEDQSLSYAELNAQANQLAHYLIAQGVGPDVLVGYPQDRCIHQLFEAQAEQTPDAIALTFEDQSLSYAELNAQANQLAHYLIAQGVGPDVLVGICIERSLEMVIGLLGILKAGGAYLPLDPQYPEERLTFMLSDIAPPVVLTQSKFAGRHFGSARVFRLDGDWTQLENYSAANPHVALRPENLAYCIYTSGSTGQPKGAGVPHRGILNRLQWMQAEYRLDGGDSVLQKTPYSFDVSVWEFFWPLMSGARLVVAKPELHKDSQGLIELIRRENITTIHFVPSMLQAFVDTPDVEQCTSLKRVICSGEALPADLVQRFQQKSPAGLHNLYGPTEASVDVSYWACPVDCQETAIPIGKPIANISLYILDRNLNPVPVGTPGELHIAGIGLGRGYLNRPGLTADKFIPDPYGQVGSRMYKTGDLVRYRTDGNIDYLGRIDHQVKIRGFRIELGEIEAQLLAYSDIKETVVLAREDQPGDKRLVAYLVEDQLGTLPLDDLKAQLRQALPDYMVPSAFVMLEAMPLSANGKLDRKRLPAPDMTEQLAKQYIAPRTETEQRLADIWQEVLGVEKVGVGDDFFDLGGHSLLATQLVSRIAARFAIDLPLRVLFETGNVAELAERVDAGLIDTSAKPRFPAIMLTSRPDAIPLSFSQQRLWFLDQLEPDSPFYNIPVALRLSGPVNIAALQKSIQEIVRRHEALRTVFTLADDGEPMQKILPSLSLTIERMDFTGYQEHQSPWQAICREEAGKPFDLANGPLLRVSLLALSDSVECRDHILMLTMHHIVSDGWSSMVLVREFTALYHAFSQKQFSPLPELAIQYADFACWQRRWLVDEELARQVAYWQDKLAGAPSILELPIDHPRPAMMTYRGANFNFEIPQVLVDGIRALAKEQNVTLFMLLLAAYQMLLSRHSGQTD
ncbi:non-ribosomal peptide synthetase, partial [Methylomonas sp. Kb3]|uniref:non-ribosomal peptide synthetase n=1 Tax=Methylomonas sp. Kb3 TaxID=1611544 RepID=UPI000CC987BA